MWSSLVWHHHVLEQKFGICWERNLCAQNLVCYSNRTDSNLLLPWKRRKMKVIGDRQVHHRHKGALQIKVQPQWRSGTASICCRLTEKPLRAWNNDAEWRREQTFSGVLTHIDYRLAWAEEGSGMKTEIWGSLGLLLWGSTGLKSCKNKNLAYKSRMI